LAGERSDSSNAGETESENIEHSSNVYGTESLVSEPINSLIFRMASLSGKATKNNAQTDQAASSANPPIKTVKTPPSDNRSQTIIGQPEKKEYIVISQEKESQLEFKGSIDSKIKAVIPDDRSVNTTELKKQFVPMTIPRQTIDSEKALSAMDELYMESKLEPKALKRDI